MPIVLPLFKYDRTHHVLGDNMETIRTFISMAIPEMPAIIDAKETLTAVSGIAVPKDIHMTLRFLGDVDVKKIKKLSEEMRSIEKYSSFDVSMKGLGAFPNVKEPRIVWIGAEVGTPFCDILSEIDGMLDSLSIDYDRKPFKPHVTVGRVKRRSESLTDVLNKHRSQDMGSFRCSEILLMSSVLTQNGARHSVVGTFRLC